MLSNLSIPEISSVRAAGEAKVISQSLLSSPVMSPRRRGEAQVLSTPDVMSVQRRSGAKIVSQSLGIASSPNSTPVASARITPNISREFSRGITSLPIGTARLGDTVVTSRASTAHALRTSAASVALPTTPARMISTATLGTRVEYPRQQSESYVRQNSEGISSAPLMTYIRQNSDGIVGSSALDSRSPRSTTGYSVSTSPTLPVASPSSSPSGHVLTRSAYSQHPWLTESVIATSMPPLQARAPSQHSLARPRRQPFWKAAESEHGASVEAVCKVLQSLVDLKSLDDIDKEDITYSLNVLKRAKPASAEQGQVKYASNSPTGASPKHHLDPSLHDGFESASDSSGSDCEIGDEQPAPTNHSRRRRAVAGTKYGVWNRRVVHVHETPPVYPKTQEQFDFLRDAIIDDAIFQAAVENGLVEKLVHAIEIQVLTPGQMIVEQGENGDADYFVLSGKVECYKTEQGASRIISECGPGQHFGDDVIMWHSQWAFSAQASSTTGSKTIVGKLSRSIYQNILVFGGMREHDRRISLLHQCPLLEHMNDEQHAKLVDVLKLRIYKAGDVVYHEGDDAHHFFIVEEGEVEMTSNSKGEAATLGEGGLFGDQALLEAHAREETIVCKTEVKVLAISRNKFERLLGPMEQIHAEQFEADPRKLIADFYSARAAKLNAAYFCVFRPCSRDAITKLINGAGVGKSLNVKGKSAKKGVLSGFVPFLQISDDAHKVDIEHSPSHGRVSIFYKTDHARSDAYKLLQIVLDEMIARGNDEDNMDDPNIEFDDTYAPNSWGLDLPEPLMHEAYIEQQPLHPHAGWETGRKSEPAFMDMNMHAIRDQAMSPKIVLYQFDEGHPMNPHGLLVAYAEDSVLPVVSDFDTFCVGSKGIDYKPLPPDQVELAMWSLERTKEILSHREEHSWTERWLHVLHDLAEAGEHHDFPPYGYGDEVSVELTIAKKDHLTTSGAVRHGAECFNFHFPQELDEEFLIIWDGFDKSPWRYFSEGELRNFLIERVADGYTFPLNPVWPLRDQGWMDVMVALCGSPDTKQARECWYPEKILDFIETTYQQFPEGFIPHELDGDQEELHKCSHVREDAELILHQAMRKAKGETILRKDGSALSGEHSSAQDARQALKGTPLQPSTVSPI